MMARSAGELFPGVRGVDHFGVGHESEFWRSGGFLQDVALGLGEALEALAGNLVENQVHRRVLVGPHAGARPQFRLGAPCGSPSDGSFPPRIPAEQPGMTHQKIAENGAAQVAGLAAFVAAQAEQDRDRMEITSRPMASWRMESSIGGKSSITRRSGATTATPIEDAVDAGRGPDHGRLHAAGQEFR